jgi:lipid II:glycine glycyltransferase (peptidoglycan interpeptide bridge formation enzyme)
MSSESPQISTIHSPTDWDDLVLRCCHSTLLQSWRWGELQISKGFQVYRLCIQFDSGLQGLAQVIIQPEQIWKFRLGKIGYVPYGPVFNQDLDSIQINQIKQTLDQIKNFLGDQDLVGLLFEPHWPQAKFDQLQIKVQDLGCRPFYRSIQAQKRWILDTTPETEVLLKNMRKHTRYALRQAVKQNLSTVKTNNLEENLKFLPVFYDLLKQTGQKHQFPIPPFVYFQNMMEKLHPMSYFLYSQDSHNQILSVALLVRFGQADYYLWAASRLNLPNYVPAQYPVIWQAILDGKANGLKAFDFWGLKNDPDQARNGGFDAFKTGFGGQYTKLIRPFWLAYKPLIMRRNLTLARLRHLFRSAQD